jgi:hypothetical protein
MKETEFINWIRSSYKLMNDLRVKGKSFNNWGERFVIRLGQKLQELDGEQMKIKTDVEQVEEIFLK